MVLSLVSFAGMTPLMLALEYHAHDRKRSTIVKMLIRQGASLSAKVSPELLRNADQIERRSPQNEYFLIGWTLKQAHSVIQLN